MKDNKLIGLYDLMSIGSLFDFGIQQNNLHKNNTSIMEAEHYNTSRKR